MANYGGPLRLYELDDDGHLYDSAPDAGLALVTGGRSAVSLPLVTDHMDIFAGNEGGANFLFCNRGDGTFEEMAKELGLNDPRKMRAGWRCWMPTRTGCSIWCAATGKARIACSFISRTGASRMPRRRKWLLPSRVRTVIAADFDNDGYEEIFFNNIGQPNRLFGRRGGRWQALEIGDALEPFRAGDRRGGWRF